MHPLEQAIPTYSSHTADKFVICLSKGMRKQIAEVTRGHHRSMDSEIITRLKQDLLQERALQDNLGVRLDSPELDLHKHGLLQRFHQPIHRQQNTLITLIAHDAELAQARAPEPTRSA